MESLFPAGTPWFCVFQVSPNGLPPASSAICVTFMYIRGGCAATATMDHVPTVVGGGAVAVWPASREVTTSLQGLSLFCLFFLCLLAQSPWFLLCCLYSPEAIDMSLRRRKKSDGETSNYITSWLEKERNYSSLTNISEAPILCQEIQGWKTKFWSLKGSLGSYICYKVALRVKCYETYIQGTMGPLQSLTQLGRLLRWHDDWAVLQIMRACSVISDFLWPCGL